ncbi:Tn3 family transposase [Rhizobium tropici]|uniref:Tn3 family transposase n=2 Tax=Rhizobium TaxID=379 RepID=A0A329Y1H9_RHITR|nr:Tn3 family transposase [Rhizobium tropici]RAX37839.1 Tn3 family transposase [Rhizobium tropici]
MPRRTILTERQRERLFDLPTDEPSLLRHYILSDGDLRCIRLRRRPRNRLGFALQLCAFRYPGRLLQPGEMIPPPMLAFIGAQIGVAAEELAEYGARSETRYQHSTALQQLYGYRPFEGQVRANMLTWLKEAAEGSRTNDLLAAEFLAELRRRNVIVPAVSTVERCCADALVAAERAIASRITWRLDAQSRTRPSSLLSETADGRVTRFVWLRQFEAGSNSNDMNSLLDRLDFLRELAIKIGTLDDIPPFRVTGLRRQGERYSADGMRDLPENRRLAILAACVVEWSAMLADAAVETHDRIVGKLYRACERKRDELLQAERASISDTLKMLSRYGDALITAHDEQDDLGLAIREGGGWDLLRQTVAQAAALTGKVSADPLEFVTDGYARFRRYAPRFLEVLAFRGGRGADSLLDALEMLRRLNRRGHRTLPVNAPLDFARAKWRKRILKGGKPDRQIWEIGILFELRNALRSGDIWLADSRRYREISTALVPIETVSETARLVVPLEADDWLHRRSQVLKHGMAQIEGANEAGILAGGAIIDGKLQIDRLEKAAPEEAAALVLKLYEGMPLVRITDILIEVDEKLHFTDAFTDLRTGVACSDRIGIMTVLLADGVNLGLRKMADASDTHTFWELLRIGKWHVREETTARALAMIVEAQSKLPMARFWGDGTTSSSDGQHFPAGSTGEALNVVNARYGNEPGLSAYSHVSDQYAPYSTQVIPATAHEAPYILDGLLQNDTGRQIREHYADTGGFTDHVFAICSVLGFRFAPRIRDLPDKRIYVPATNEVPPVLQPMIGGRINTRQIRENWPDILRLAASMAAGTVVPSQILRKLAAYPRQNSLALALREVGRLERSIFMLDWLSDIDLQRRAQIGLNKGEAHHALKRAVNFNRRGEIRDRSSEGQQHRIAGLNLLTAIIIYWNAWKLGEIVAEQIDSGEQIDLGLLPHVSPLGWEHITLTGEYRWPPLR